MAESDVDAAAAEQVLEIVGALARELHPHRRGVAVTLDSSLDRDLGFDSLARSELLLRISEATGVELADALLGSAERPRDLLTALCAAPSRRPAVRVTPPASAVAAQSIEIPHGARTLATTSSLRTRL
jgi:acyl carrier protein